MFKVYDLFNDDTCYQCDNAEDVGAAVLEITKSQEEAEKAITIAKLMSPYDRYICFNKYFIAL